ncbi:MAG: DUF4159 domain-containing protein [Acidobacteriota bacterium]|nr:DUF4159 domain-containing protein [Acidobacteriota bacterium]
MPKHSRWLTRLVLGVLAAAVLTSVGDAQVRWDGFRRSRMPPRFKPTQHRDKGFTFCRLAYTSVRREREGYGWSTDYPAADQNFMIRLSELTSTTVDFDDRGNPNHWVVEATDPALFTCPFVIASDVGTIGLRGDEVDRLREYLLKGGFLWVDDFWGSAAWDQWSSEIARVLPPAEFPIIDLPLDHPLFKAHFNIWEVPQITNIRFWRRYGGSSTSERGRDSDVAHFRVITDEDGRILVAMTHNTDIQDSWEREGDDPRFFEQFAPDGYSLGVNVILHAMSH